MSKIIDFYLQLDADDEDRMIHEIWGASDQYFELAHNYIQWLFPLDEKSLFNVDAPILTSDDIALFNKNSELALNLSISFYRFIKFLGLQYKSPNFNRLPEFDELMFTKFNHNWLRISRLLKCLTILGLKTQANDFYQFLIHNDYGNELSRLYWLEAIS